MLFEVDLNKLSENFHLLKKNSNEISAAVKANAYGFGIKEVSRTLYDIGCKTFCVSNTNEGKIVRSTIGKNANIICLNGFIEHYKEEYIHYNITPAISSIEQIHYIKKYNIPFWLFVDTGLNRTGIKYSEFLSLKLSELSIIGIMSHLLNTTMNQYDQKQLTLIDELYNEYHNKYQFSICKTSGVNLCEKYDNLARIGHGLYFAYDAIGTKNIGKVTSTIVKIAHIKAGEYVGYDKAFCAEKDMQIAIVDCGYSYGLDKDHPFFLINGIKCPLLGKISMDLSAIDISKIHSIGANDIVDVFGDFTEIAQHLKFSLGYLTTKLNSINMTKKYIQ